VPHYSEPRPKISASNNRCGSRGLLREYPGLRVSSFARTDNKSKPKENMKHLLRSTSARPLGKWLPPAEIWSWFKRLVTGQDPAQTIEEDWEGM
jgi:hypothetical protein